MIKSKLPNLKRFGISMFGARGQGILSSPNASSSSKATGTEGRPGFKSWQRYLQWSPHQHVQVQIPLHHQPPTHLVPALVCKAWSFTFKQERMMEKLCLFARSNVSHFKLVGGSTLKVVEPNFDLNTTHWIKKRAGEALCKRMACLMNWN
jgi:hypothetical protein